MLTLSAYLATLTQFNGLTITTSTGTLTIANGKTLTIANTLTFSGTETRLRVSSRNWPRSATCSRIRSRWHENEHTQGARIDSNTAGGEITLTDALSQAPASGDLAVIV